MIYIFGLFVALSSLIAAASHLHQEAQFFWDFVAFTCVTGGTLSVALMIFPWHDRRTIFRSFATLFATASRDEGKIVQDCISFLRAVQGGASTYDGNVGTLAGETLRDGMELLALDFSKEKIHSILEERIHQSFERMQKVAGSVRSLAKYPPAFGLAGTVLGLVTLMRKVSEGADAKQTGLFMAVALMATFYGLLVANLLVNPAGENMTKNSLCERKKAEIALQTVLLMAEKASLLEAQEYLNSYVSKEHRVNVISASNVEAA